MIRASTLNQPLIFVGAPRSGVTLISDIVMHHDEICWLDESFEKHPKSDFQHRLFKRKCAFRNKALQDNSFLGSLAREFSPVPSEVMNFWDDYTREEVDFYRGFARGKHATPVEISSIREILSRRIELSGRSRLALRFTGPSRLCYLNSLFPDAKFVHICRDPASTVHSMISTEEWEYQGKNLLWWRGAYSLQELAQYDRLRGHAVAGTAFQLNKLIQTTMAEATELDLNMLSVNYEDFVATPERIVDKILDFAELPTNEMIDAALKQREIRCSNKVLKMPATDVNTVYTWCPGAYNQTT
ncbi:sulfotransferase [Grimontia sp. NTOU-MAR1]|uniref:sulfotransferase n=1 Tax=Grimontia sp. NTOU-MAR1 TaxID=3111011 RepID=UPI002DC01189|nr:sulfotransferase [Grimontia sp. NTOU-MAR1]WRV98605.1 sulfotransferase [Grimontia sp. NTOU-MAR1]